MEDREFFDLLYNLWAKTPGAENEYWGYDSDEGDPPSYLLYSQGEDLEVRKPLASFSSEEAVNFISAIHGCLPDLVRRLHAALDEVDRADYDRDSRECRIAELEMELMEWEKRYE